MSSLAAKARFQRLGGLTGTQSVPALTAGTNAVLTVTDATTARTAAVADNNRIVYFTNASPIEYLIKPFSEVPLPVGAIVYARQGGAGQVTFVPDSGVTFETPDSYSTRAVESLIAMKHYATDEWHAIGDLEAVIAANSVIGVAGSSPGAPAAISATTNLQTLIRRAGSLVWDLLGMDDITGLVAALAAKAPLASPALTGTPTAPTAAGGTNTTQIATTAFVLAEIASGGGGATIVNGAQYLIDTGSTADSDPGAGLLKYNNATQASASFLYLDDNTDDGVSLTAMWAGLNEGGFVYIQSATDQDTWQIWHTSSIVDASGYVKFGVSLIADGGSFADGDLVFVTVQQGSTASGASVIPSGTSNPVSPVDNELFLRTDVLGGTIIQYKSSLAVWLSVHEILLGFIPNAGFAGSTTAGGIYHYHPIRDDYGLYLTRWAASSYTSGTNNGSNYWTHRLEWLTDALVASSLASFTTAADTSARMTFHNIAINALLSGSARSLGATNITKTGSPGTALLFSAIYAKLVIP